MEGETDRGKRENNKPVLNDDFDYLNHSFLDKLKE